jgi:hypothetical protein
VLLVPTDAFQGAGILNLAAAAIAGALVALEMRHSSRRAPA